MVSLPDDLLDRLDRLAREQGTSRSGLLRQLAEQDLARHDGSRRASIDALLGPPGHYGGRAAGEVRELRKAT